MEKPGWMGRRGLKRDMAWLRWVGFRGPDFSMSATKRPRQNSALATLGWAGVASILWRYFQEKAVEQVKSVWFIVAYLLIFQVAILQLPIVHSLTIALGLLIVIAGLTFFMEGLRLGLMPFGETIGAILPRNSRLPQIMVFAFLLGMGATFAEPAISVLKKAGAGVEQVEAPLLYDLLNVYAGQLVTAVGVGVGVAVMLGVLRFFFGWSLKVLILPVVGLLLALTVYAFFDPVLNPVIGLAWDCGAVTTGPVTVPLVLALGIGVCRIVGSDDAGSAGFGIVTLASLFPVLAVLILAMGHAAGGGYEGRMEVAVVEVVEKPQQKVSDELEDTGKWDEAPALNFTEEEFAAYQKSRRMKGNGEPYQLYFRGGEVVLENGRIVHRNAEIVLEKKREQGVIEGFVRKQVERPWDSGVAWVKEAVGSVLMALQAIIPLCGFLFVTLLVVLKERLRKGDEIALGVVFSVVGMALFGLGLTLGLTPLGIQLGSNIPVTFATIVPWGMSEMVTPMFENPVVGKWLTIGFAFFLGYGATLAEPALNALGQTVENVTVGVFQKSLLMHVVAFGVGLGIAAGVAQMAFESLNLTMLLVPPYVLLLVLTVISTEEFVNFAWDSAGVTTGPITVPLVLAMGLGIGATIPGVRDGFGILALASVGPILTVLTVGLVVQRSRKAEMSLTENELL